MEKAVIVSLVLVMLCAPLSSIHADSVSIEAVLSITQGQFIQNTKVVLTDSLNVSVPWEAVDPSLVSLSIGVDQATMISLPAAQFGGFIDARDSLNSAEEETILSLF